MRTVFVLFDTLNRRSLSPYGAQSVHTPNFQRLAERSVTFDRHYVGSLPCMPARRDMQTGRLNFLHRGWGPLEPFDNAFPELLEAAGVYSHLVSDHYHYWEDGGATYHTRYSSFEFIRGQEADPWQAMVRPPFERFREMYHRLQYSEAARNRYRVHMVNREFIREEADFPAVQCFDQGLAFLERNHAHDDWLLQVETFDPHEPFFAPKRFRDAYPTGYKGPILDWPPYARVGELPEECDELRANYAALLALCDEQLGKLLDTFDRLGLWDNTALVVATDHGFLLGEHDWWAKNRMPVYQEVAHIPLFIHHPQHQASAGQRRQALTQTMDLMPTLLDLHGVAPPAQVQGKSLLPLLEGETRLRDALLYGHWGAAVNITDGRYTYFRYAPEGAPKELYQYTLVPMHMATRFSPEELAGASLCAPFRFTKGAPLLKVPGIEKSPMRMLMPGYFADTETVLFDLLADPGQLHPLHDPAQEARLSALMEELMDESEAPPELFARLGLVAPSGAVERGRPHVPTPAKPVQT
ncbi:MAG: sulfatase-like hydrolase/transferase [Burkholderiaceae bacterium]